MEITKGKRDGPLVSLIWKLSCDGSNSNTLISSESDVMLSSC